MAEGCPMTEAGPACRRRPAAAVNGPAVWRRSSLFAGAIVSGAIFSEAVPRSVDFAGAVFRGADLSRAALTGAVSGSAVFSSGVFACAVFRARTRACRLENGVHDPVRDPPSNHGLTAASAFSVVPRPFGQKKLRCLGFEPGSANRRGLPVGPFDRSATSAVRSSAERSSEVLSLLVQASGGQT